MKSGGFTIIELLLVVGLFAFVAVGTAPYGARILFVFRTKTTQEHLVGAIREAQQSAMSGKGTGVWGVCVSGLAIRVFEGSCASPLNQTDWIIPGGVSVGGLNSLLFSIRGEPDATAIVTISSSYATQVVTLGDLGAIEIN